MTAVDAEPMRDHLRRYFKHGHKTKTQVAAESGYSIRRLQKLLRGDTPRILIETADGLCEATGESLSVLYPDDDDGVYDEVFAGG